MVLFIWSLHFVMILFLWSYSYDLVHRWSYDLIHMILIHVAILATNQLPIWPFRNSCQSVFRQYDSVPVWGPLWQRKLIICVLWGFSIIYIDTSSQDSPVTFEHILTGRSYYMDGSLNSSHRMDVFNFLSKPARLVSTTRAYLSGVVCWACNAPRKLNR